MSAPTCSATVRERLGRLGIRGELLQAFLAWAWRAGYHDPLDRYSDHDLVGRVAEFAGATGRAGVTLARGLPPWPIPTRRPTRPGGLGDDDVALRALIARLVTKVVADRQPARLCAFEPPIPTPAIVRREARR